MLSMRGKYQRALRMKLLSSFRMIVVIFTLVCSTSSQAQYYVLYAFLRPQGVIRIYSIVQINRLGLINRVTAIFHPASQSSNPDKNDNPINTLNFDVGSSGQAPVALEVGGINRSAFRYGVPSNTAVLTEYIRSRIPNFQASIYQSNSCDPMFRSLREHLLSHLGIGFDVSRSYPGGSPDSMNLLGIHTSEYPYIDLTVPINQLNPEQILQSPMEELYPVESQEHELSTESHEDASLMAYFTHQGDNGDITLNYIPDFQSFVCIYRGVYYLLMTPVHIFRSLTRQ